MSSIHGKNSLSFRRVKTEESSSSATTISQDIKFAHKASGGDTSIDLSALVLPSVEMPNFINPTGTELAAINLQANKKSLILVSSLNGTLLCDLSYEINTSQIITLNFAAAAGEIFTGQLRTTQATANVVDAETYTCTGTLIAGQTDIALGQAFDLNAYPTSQIGQVMLHIDGAQQFRNVANATAVPLADGNYEEVDAGGGLTNVLRVNQAFGVDVAWAVTSTGLILNSSNNVTQQQLDSISGQVDALIPTVASLAGVPETNFQAGPNDVDLKAFADKLYQACQDIDTLQAALVTINAKEVDIVTKETVTYTGFTSRSAGSFVLLPDLLADSSSSLISATNTDHTRYTFTENISFIAHSTYNGSAANGSFAIRLYNSSDVLITLSTGITDNGGGGQEVTLATEAAVGDYLVYYSTINPSNTTATNFSVIATKITKTKISNL